MTTSTTIKGGRRKAVPTSPAAKSASSPIPKPLIDRFGVRHSEAVLTNWSPDALAALGIRRADGGTGDTSNGGAR